MARSGSLQTTLLWRALDGPRRVVTLAALAALGGLITEVERFGWLDAATLLVVLSLLRLMARTREPHPHDLPFRDGTLVIASGCWLVALTLLNTLDGADSTVQLVVFAAAVLITGAGLRLRAFDPYGFD